MEWMQENAACRIHVDITGENVLLQDSEGEEWFKMHECKGTFNLMFYIIGCSSHLSWLVHKAVVNNKQKSFSVCANSLVVSASTYCAHGNLSLIPVLKSFCRPCFPSLSSQAFQSISTVLSLKNA